MALPSLLSDLLTSAGPPGHESAPAKIWRDAAEAFGANVSVDAMGTSVARVAGRSDHPLLAAPNLLVLPQLGSATHATRERMADMAVDNLLAGLAGERMPHCANPEVYR